ncbi:MAG: FixH family protein [Rhodocyclaceae bacterium]|nr:FixH family protein [Rhodocyclaceae bacterium]MDP1957008.1 FixH family protein [Rhodocyclaceae bacterium]
MTATAIQNAKPWYREPWPWLLMILPATSVVVGLAFAWTAVVTSDGLVTEDYYKQGQMVGETLVQSRRATELGIAAGLLLTNDNIRIRLTARQADMPMPGALLVTVSHPTRAGQDQRITLKPVGDAYVGSMQAPLSGHRLVLIEDEAKTWRLVGSVVLPAANETVIGGG